MTVNVREMVQTFRVTSDALCDVGIIVEVFLDIRSNQTGFLNAALVHLPKQLLDSAP